MAWSDGYFTGLNYTHGYYPEMNPGILRLACLCNAVELRLPEAPTYLELGFGHGVSINMHAATSEGSFWGNDFNPAQALEAQMLAEVSGADLRLSEESFAEFASRTDLPQFDIIALHGIWSWVSDENRKIITDIIRRKLRPGGVAYISWNCLPGWAPIVPMRQLMSLYNDHGGGKMSKPAEMVDGAVQFVDEIAKAGSFFFRDNPFAKRHLEDMSTLGRNYIAHEYMNADWHLQQFSDMVRGLDDAKLTYVGSARLLDGIDAFQLEDDAIKLISRIGHPVMRETVRDYMMNRRFRTDIFIKGARMLSSVEHRDAWNAQAFVLTTSIMDIPRKLPCGRGEIELPAEKYDRIVQALADDNYKPKRIEDILQEKALRKLSFQDVMNLLTVLTGAGFVVPAKAPSEITRQQCRKLNAHVLERSLINANLRYMASPISGGGIAVPQMTQWFIRGLASGESSAQALADSVWGILDGAGERLTKHGRKIEDKDENMREIRSAAIKFLRHERPLFEALELIAPHDHEPR